MMRSVQRILAVFECFTVERPTLRIQEIADSIGLPKPTALRILRSLDEAGYLVRLENQQYCLSFRFTKLSGLVESTLNIRQLARSTMVELAQKTNETITLNIVDGRDRVCIDVLDTPSALMSVTRAGERVRLVDGATAKTLMAHLPKKEQQKAIGYAVKKPGMTRSKLLAELQRIRHQGYSVTHNERVLGVSAISAPIHAVNNESRHCITIAGPTVRMRSREKPFLQLIMKAAADISRRLGGDLLK